MSTFEKMSRKNNDFHILSSSPYLSVLHIQCKQFEMFIIESSTYKIFPATLDLKEVKYMYS